MPSITVINHTQYMHKRTAPIQYIVLHYSASTQSRKNSAMLTVTTLDQRGYSSDFAVDDTTIIQFADDPAKWCSTACQRPSSSGTAAGKGSVNNNSVSIEMSSTLAGGKWVPNDPTFKFTNEVLNNTAYLCKLLIAKYNIPKQNIIRHYDIMGKPCPGIIGWNLGPGSNSEAQYRAFVDSLYDGSIPTDSIGATYDYSEYTGGGTSGGGGTQQYTSNSGGVNSIGGAGSNTVLQLSSAGKSKENVLKVSDDRKSEFESLRTSMTNNAPQMGRDILLTSELYDSNILKGSQESKKERT